MKHCSGQVLDIHSSDETTRTLLLPQTSRHLFALLHTGIIQHMGTLDGSSTFSGSLALHLSTSHDIK